MKKLCALWVPNLLTIDQKRIPMRISQTCLDRFKQNKSKFKRHFITIDETWIYYYTPEKKKESKKWIKAGWSVPKMAKIVQSAGKVMAIVFWNYNGALLLSYFAEFDKNYFHQGIELLEKFWDLMFCEIILKNNPNL